VTITLREALVRRLLLDPKAPRFDYVTFTCAACGEKQTQLVPIGRKALVPCIHCDCMHNTRTGKTHGR